MIANPVIPTDDLVGDPLNIVTGDLIDAMTLEGGSPSDLINLLLEQVTSLEVDCFHAWDMVGHYRHMTESAHRRADAADAANTALIEKIDDLTAKALALTSRFLTLSNAPAASAHLDQADTDILENLAQRHTGRGLSDLLNHLGFGSAENFRSKYTTLPDAQKAIATKIVDCREPVMAYMAETKQGRNGSLYLSVNFGFNNVAVFNGNVAETFADTYNTVYLGDWRSIGFSHEFRPPIQIIMEREANGYPRIVEVEEIN